MKKRKWTSEEVQQWYLCNNAMPYSNKEDGNIIVRKPRRLGWTFNWGNPWSYVVQGILFAAIACLIYLLSI